MPDGPHLTPDEQTFANLMARAGSPEAAAQSLFARLEALEAAAAALEAQVEAEIVAQAESETEAPPADAAAPVSDRAG